MQENNFKVNPHSLKTAVSKVEKDKIVTRGYNQRDLIEKIRYSDMVFLLLKGKLPSIRESKIFNHVLVSFCDHGVTPPSTQTFDNIIRFTSKLCSCRCTSFIWKQTCRSY